MTKRRNFLAAAGAVAATSLSACSTRERQGVQHAGAGRQECAVFDGPRQANVTPDAALQMLKEGNARFVAGKSVHCDFLAQARSTAEGQAPFACVVGCIDSRVPPELVFDQDIGDIFAARIAGNFVNTDIIGSLEFATRLAGAKCIVVLGHTECGAVKGAIDDAKLGNLTATLANIRPSVVKVKGIDGPQNSKNKKLVQAVADQNAQDAARMLLERSEVLSGLVKDGKLKVAAAMYDLPTGRVTWLS